MRHGRKINHLGRKSAHRKALLANLTIQLIRYKRIKTTVAKAKALRKYAEPLITRSKADSMHARRVVFSYLQSNEAVTELFDEVGPKIGDRPGGYTRIIKLGTRQGDAAEMCMIELVDFNDIYTQAKEQKASKKKRTRRGGKKKTDAEIAAETATVEETLTETAEEVTDEVAETVEEVTEEATDAAEEVAEAAEETVEAVEEEVTETVEEAKEEVAEAVEEATEAVEETAEEVAEATEEVAEEATEAVEEAAEEATDAAEEVAEAAEEATEEAGEEEADDEPKKRRG